MSLFRLRAARAVAWSPHMLTRSILKAWWDASRSDLVTEGATLTFLDSVAGYSAVQATAASQPAYDGTQFTFDGTADNLACTDSALLTQLGSATPYELWAVTDQQATASDTTQRNAVSVGSNTSGTTRSLARVVSSGANRLRSGAGIGGGTTVTAEETTVDYSGWHVVRSRYDGTTMRVFIDGVEGASVAAVPSTSAARVRLGANASNTAGALWNGSIRVVLITSLLSDTDAALLQAWCAGRMS